MCGRPSAPPAPPPPPPVTLPPTPPMQTVVSPTTVQTTGQSTPAAPRIVEAQKVAAQKAKEVPGADLTIKRRGKRGMVIQLAQAAGTSIPGT